MIKKSQEDIIKFSPEGYRINLQYFDTGDYYDPNDPNWEKKRNNNIWKDYFYEDLKNLYQFYNPKYIVTVVDDSAFRSIVNPKTGEIEKRPEHEDHIACASALNKLKDEYNLNPGDKESEYKAFWARISHVGVKEGHDVGCYNEDGSRKDVFYREVNNMEMNCRIKMYVAKLGRDEFVPIKVLVIKAYHDGDTDKLEPKDKKYYPDDEDTYVTSTEVFNHFYDFDGDPWILTIPYELGYGSYPKGCPLEFIFKYFQSGKIQP